MFNLRTSSESGGMLQLENRKTRPVSPFKEMGAYEALWTKVETTFKTLAMQFAEFPGSLPSDFTSGEESSKCANFVSARFKDAGVKEFGVRVSGTADYPSKLRDAVHPVEFLYYIGWWDLVWSPSVAVVGTRKPTKAGASRARKLSKMLAVNDYTVVSGLAAGIDTVAHRTAMKYGGRTFAVLGTPISESYPKENADLQRKITKEFLVVSQVPVKRYSMQTYRENRLFFPARNITMSALTQATIIVEAGETSGTLIQARAALQQNRQLFILDSCFHQGHKWPEKLAAQGATRIKDYEEILERLIKCADNTK